MTTKGKKSEQEPPVRQLTRSQAIDELASAGRDALKLRSLSTPVLQHAYRLAFRPLRPAFKDGKFIGLSGEIIVVIEDGAIGQASPAAQTVQLESMAS